MKEFFNINNTLSIIWNRLIKILVLSFDVLPDKNQGITEYMFHQLTWIVELIKENSLLMQIINV